nr:hypothetical protein [Tanacetum cinerariifolium]
MSILSSESSLRDVFFTNPHLMITQPQGFAAALVVLITRASQSRQHDKSELPKVSSLVPFTNKLFEAPHHPSFLQLLINCLDHNTSSFIFQCTPSSLWQGVNITESLRVLIWSIYVLFIDARSGSFWLGDVDFLLIVDLEVVHDESREFNRSAHQIIKGFCRINGFLRLFRFGKPVTFRCNLSLGFFIIIAQKTDVKSRSVDGGLVASVVGGGVGVDRGGGGVKVGDD